MDKNKRKWMWRLPFLALLIVGSFLIIRHNQSMPYQKDSGFVFGTIYHMTYQSDRNLKKEIEEELRKVDMTLSPFNKESMITAINNNEDVTTDEMFESVFSLAMRISKETDGFYDITVSPLVNAWGFGFKNDIRPDSAAIDSLLEFVGYDKIRLENHKIVKKDPRTILDCSSIAKGYGVDCVARLLRSLGVQNYMVEIGGEIAASGQSPRHENWKVGISKPVEDAPAGNEELQDIIRISDSAMATSGNYRNFYYKDGKRFAHTIDPKSGYPVDGKLLSATVIAKDCATADAYATAFMVLGFERTMSFIKDRDDLKVVLIYIGDDDRRQVYCTPSLKAIITELDQKTDSVANNL